MGRWVGALIGSVAATALALWTMFAARDRFQVRTLPERVLEWVLLFIPPEEFEKGIQSLGTQAKVVGLYAAVAGLCAILVALGLVALGRRWPPAGLVALGAALYVFAMGVVMPVTGAGPFASGLFQNVFLVNLCYLAVALAYAAGLLFARMALAAGSRGATGGRLKRRLADGRRAFFGAAAGALGAFAAATWLDQRGAGVANSLPTLDLDKLATPTPPPTRPVPMDPTLAAAPSPTDRPASVAPATPDPAGVTAAQGPPPVPELPVPLRGPRKTERDKDGALSGSQRQPGEVAAFLTPNNAFYITTKNPVADPLVKPEGWRLILDGAVERPVQLDYRTLRRLPSVEIVKTLECISNFVAKCELVPFGCELIGNARWRGVRLVDLLNLAGGLKPGVTTVALIGTDEFVSALPVAAASDPDTIVAYEMNGEVLPYEHGYPARVLVPGRYGMKSTKWVMAVRPMTAPFQDWYAQRGWSAEGIVKTMTRIDTPALGATLPAGATRVAGVAYAGDRGVSKVDVSADGGVSWREARFLEPAAGKDAWVRWEATFDLATGRAHTLVARATDGTGALQPEAFSLTQPDGSAGWNAIEVRTT